MRGTILTEDLAVDGSWPKKSGLWQGYFRRVPISLTAGLGRPRCLGAQKPFQSSAKAAVAAPHAGTNAPRTSSVSSNSETAGCSSSTNDADQPPRLRSLCMDPDLIDGRVSRNQSATAPAFACLLTKSCRTGISYVETSRAGTDVLQRVQCHQRKKMKTSLSIEHCRGANMSR